jgi:hypothetical protein
MLWKDNEPYYTSVLPCDNCGWDLDYDKQKMYRLLNVEDGRCEKCPAPRVAGSARYCDYHRLYTRLRIREYMKQRYKRKLRG